MTNGIKSGMIVFAEQKIYSKSESNLTSQLCKAEYCVPDPVLGRKSALRRISKKKLCGFKDSDRNDGK